MNQKRLHIHTVPILLLAFGFLAVMGAANWSSYTRNSTSTVGIVDKSLIHRGLTITTHRSGLASINLTTVKTPQPATPVVIRGATSATQNAAIYDVYSSIPATTSSSRSL